MFCHDKILPNIYKRKNCMSLPKDSQEELFNAKNELQDFLPEDDPMIVFENTLYPAFNDDDFAKCYSTKGRNAISPSFFRILIFLL
jgi:hypothetical protein